MKRRIFSLLFAFVFMFGISVPVLAASWDVGDFAGIENAFQTDTDSQVTLNLQNDITWDHGLTANQGQTYTFNGNGNTMSDVRLDGAGTVEINADLGSDFGDALTVEGGTKVTVVGDIDAWSDGVVVKDSTVAVTGDITAKHMDAVQADNSDVDVTGAVTAGNYGVNASNGSDIDVTGNVTGGNAGVFVQDSTASVDGDVVGDDGEKNGPYPWSGDMSSDEGYSGGGNGVFAINSQVDVTGDVTGGTGYGVSGSGGDGVLAFDGAEVSIGGSVTGGDVVADPSITPKNWSSMAGDGVKMSSDSHVSVGGDVTGGSTNAINGVQGNGLSMEYDAAGENGSLSIGGTLSGSNASAHVNDAGETGLGALPSFDIEKVENDEDGIESSGYTEDEHEVIVDAILGRSKPAVSSAYTVYTVADDFWQRVERLIRNAEKGERITVDAAHRTTMPAFVMDAIRECEVTLIIQWDGGEDILIEKAYAGDTAYTVFKLAELTELLK